MMSYKTSVSLLCLALLPAIVVTEDHKRCISKFADLEKSLLSRESNLDFLKEAFFPVNRQMSITVDVYYYMSRDNTSTISSLESLDFDYKFCWTLTSVHMFIGPALLECLSLYIYRPNVITARLIVDPICGGEEINPHKSDSVCNETKYMDTEAGTPVRLLNELTTHLKSYVLHQSIHEDTRGYTVYFFDRNNSENFCVIGYDAVYASNSLILNLSTTFLVFFLAFGIPATFAYGYDTLYQYAKKPSTKYFIWAVVMGSIVIYPLILTADIWIIVVRGIREKIGASFVYYIIALADIIILPILDIICVLLLWRVNPNIFKKDFPIPHPPYSYSCHNYNCGPIFIQITAVILLTICLQHLSFHGLYILLGFAASPLQATSLLAFYIAAAFCVVSFLAVVLKVIDIKTIKGWKVESCVIQLIPLLMVVLFAGFVIFFIAFHVQTTVLVGEYQNSGGLTYFIGSLAPSLLLSLVGLIEKRFVDFDMTKSKSKKTADGSETANQSSSSVEANEVLKNRSAVSGGESADRSSSSFEVNEVLENASAKESDDGESAA